jgi:hypothetical protein
MNTKFDSVLKNFLKENLLDQAEQRAKSGVDAARTAIAGVPAQDKAKVVADLATQIASNPNNNNDPREKQIESFKKLLDTTGQNASYGPTDFAKEHPELEDHPQLKSWYTPQSTPNTTSSTSSTTSSTTSSPAGGSSNAFNLGNKK